MKFWAKNKKGFAEGSHSVGTRALFVKFLCIILFLVTCIGIPSTVFGADDSINTFEFLENPYRYSEIHGAMREPIDYGDGYLSSYTWSEYGTTRGYGNVIVYPIKGNKEYNFNVSKGDKLTFKYDIPFLSVCPNAYYDFYISDAENIYADDIYDSGYENFNGTTGTITYTFKSPATVKVRFSIFPNKQSTDNVVLSFNNLSIDVVSEQSSFFDRAGQFFDDLFKDLTAWFNSLFEWLRDIRDNAVQLGNDLKSWFSDLSNNIKGFFTDLKNNIKEQFTNMINNLKTFFSDVGQWFEDIGDRIGDFFTNLWNNITVTINGITDGVKEWWQGVVDFFHSLFVPEEGYFDKYKQDWEDWARLHFALFYDVMDLFDSIFDGIFTGLTDTNSLIITIPEMQLPVLNKFVFIKETSIDLGTLYDSHNAFKYFYDLYRICFSGFSYFLLIKYLQRTLSEVITGDGDTL